MNYIDIFCFRKFPIFSANMTMIFMVLWYAWSNDKSREQQTVDFAFYRNSTTFQNVISSALVHNSEVNLLINCFGFLQVSTIFEITEGAISTFVTFWASHVMGIILHSLSTTDALTGASAGIFGLCAGQISIILVNWQEMKKPIFRVILVFLVVTTELGSLLHESHYDIIAHVVGGSLAGIFSGLAIVKNMKVKKYELVVSWVATFVYIVICTTSLIYMQVCAFIAGCLVTVVLVMYNIDKHLSYIQNPVTDRDKSII